MSDEDFGFTLEDDAIVMEPDDKVQELMDVIVPFLTALKKDPEKETMKWPNRVSVVDKLLEKLYSIQEE